jgi:hypothetical protein
MLKLYDKTSPLFATLPKEISAVLLHTFSDLMDSDLSIICQMDPMEIPDGLQYFDADLEHEDVPGNDSDDDPDSMLNDENDENTDSVDRNLNDPQQPSTSRQVMDSSDSDSDGDDDPGKFMTLRNNKRVHFQD